MAGVQLSPDELKGATEIAPVKLSPDELAGATPIGEPAPTDDRGFFAKAKDTLEGGAKAIGHTAANAASRVWEATKHPLDQLAHPTKYAMPYAEARQLARGVDDVTSLGYGQRVVDAARRGLGLDQPGQAEASEAETAAAAPDARAAGQVGGMFLPNPVGAAGKLLSKAAVPVVAEALAPGTERLLSKLASTRVVGPVVAPAAAASAGAARGLASYEATAPIAAALSANASGHRLEAAREAASDPAGLLTSGAMGAVEPALSTAGKAAGKAAGKFVEHATKAADEYIPRDIVGEAKGASTETARRQMSRAAKYFPEVLGRDPEMRQAIGDARGNDLPKVQQAVDLMQERLRAAQADKPEVYKAIDQALPDGGVKMKDVVKAYKDDIHEWEHGEHGGEEYAQQIAQKLKQRLATITGSEAYGAKPQVGIGPDETARLSDLERVRTNAKGPAAAELDKQIAELKSGGEVVSHKYDPDAVVSTRRLRKLATDAQNTAFMGEGGLNGTERYKRALDVASTPTRLLESQLENARPGAKDAVERLEVMDRDTHALLAAKAVMDQRLATAKANSTGAGGAPAHAAHSVAQIARGMGGLGGAALLAGSGHPVPAALMAAATLAPMAQRAVTESAARFGRSPGYASAVDQLARVARKTSQVADFVRQAVPAGISAADARRMWQAAHPREAVSP